MTNLLPVDDEIDSAADFEATLREMVRDNPSRFVLGCARALMRYNERLGILNDLKRANRSEWQAATDRLDRRIGYLRSVLTEHVERVGTVEVPGIGTLYLNTIPANVEIDERVFLDSLSKEDRDAVTTMSLSKSRAKLWLDAHRGTHPGVREVPEHKVLAFRQANG